jgi:predicted dehydrogenase
MADLRVGVVGVGHLGRHHARIVASLAGVRLAGVVDTRIDQARRVADPLGAPAFADHSALFGAVDAVSIAVPTAHHRAVAGAFLERGVHALVEKPLATSLNDAEALVRLAREHDAILQVGHIERFNPALRVWQESGLRARYIQAERLSTYTFRSTDIGVVLDLMIHDIDLVLSMVRAEVAAVSAVGLSVFGGFEDVASARLWFDDGTVADLAASRASMHAVRKLRVWSEQGYAALDFKTKQGLVVHPGDALRAGELQLDEVDLADSEAVKRHLFGKVLQVERRDESSDTREPLALELQEFADAVRSGRPPRVSGVEALRAMRVADLVIQGIATHPWEASSARGADRAHGLPAPHVMRAAARRTADVRP